MPVLRMEGLNLQGKRVLIREDLNVPIKNGQIKSETRILAALPTIKQALAAGAGVMIMSHLGRPKEGEYSEEASLAPIAQKLSELLGKEVRLIKDYLKGFALHSGQVVLLENVRFNVGEDKDSPELGKLYASLCDIFVMDAFGTAHRAQASTSAVAKFAPIACAGPLLIAELTALQNIMEHPQKPLVAILGGSKVSTKLGIIESLAKKVDALIIGGGIANNFLMDAGFEVGKSLVEVELKGVAGKILESAKKNNTQIPLPSDVVVGTQFDVSSPAVVKKVTEVTAEDMILDIGPETRKLYAKILAEAKTILWNGPVGAFEFDQFGEGTKTLCAAVASSAAFSVVGGGDSLAALEKYGYSDKISYTSTGGGAFLEYLEGKTLPAVAVLMERANKG